MESPRVGCVVDARGEVRTLWGFRANFILGEAATSGAVSAACSDSFGLVKTGEELLVMDRAGVVVHRREAVSGTAILGFDDRGTPAFAYLHSSRQILHWEGSGWERWDVAMEQSPVAIAAQGEHLLALVRREDELYLLRVASDGQSAVLARVASSARHAVLYPSGAFVLAEEQSVVVHRADGRQQRLDVSTPVIGLHAMSSQWVRVQFEAQSMGLLLREDDSELYLIPGDNR